MLSIGDKVVYFPSPFSGRKKSEILKYRGSICVVANTTEVTHKKYPGVVGVRFLVIMDDDTIFPAAFHELTYLDGRKVENHAFSKGP